MELRDLEDIVINKGISALLSLQKISRKIERLKGTSWDEAVHHTHRAIEDVRGIVNTMAIFREEEKKGG